MSIVNRQESQEPLHSMSVYLCHHSLIGLPIPSHSHQIPSHVEGKCSFILRSTCKSGYSRLLVFLPYHMMHRSPYWTHDQIQRATFINLKFSQEDVVALMILVPITPHLLKIKTESSNQMAFQKKRLPSIPH
jgi:hypothetical protein